MGARRLHSSNIVLIFIILCAALLRLLGLDNSSLWMDELFSWSLSNQLTLSEVIGKVQRDVHPPGYQIILFYVIRHLGDTEWMLRFPSAIAGVSSVIAIYFLGKQLYGHREGVISAAIMAVSWAPIYYSQEARSYSLLLFFSIILSYYWVSLMRTLEAHEKPSVITIAGYIIASIGACYLHYFGLQLVFLQFLGFLVLFARRRRALIMIGVIYGSIFAAYLAWIPSMLKQMVSNPGLWITKPSFFEFVGSYVEFAYRVNWWILLVFVIPGYAYAAIVGMRGIKGGWDSRSIRRLIFSSGGLLFLWAITPFLAAFAQSIILKPVLTDRNLITLLPAIYLLLARGIAVAPLRFSYLWTGALCLALFLSLTLDHHYYTEPQKDQYREAAAHIAERNGKPKIYPVVAYAWQKDFFDYYLERFDSAEKVSILAGHLDDVESIAALLQSRKADGFWYIVGQKVPDRGFFSLLDSAYQLQSEVEFKQARVRLYLVRD